MCLVDVPRVPIDQVDQAEVDRQRGQNATTSATTFSQAVRLVSGMGPPYAAWPVVPHYVKSRGRLEAQISCRLQPVRPSRPTARITSV